MKKILSLFAILTLSSAPALATSVKVIKKGGNRAVVEFPKGTQVEVGEVLNLSSGDSGDNLDVGSTGVGSRQHKLALGVANVLSLEDGGGLAHATSVGLGFNMGTIEITPSVALTKASGGDFGFGAGLSFEVNFVENKVGQSFVPAVILSTAFAKAGSISTLSFSGGFVGKFFVLGQSQTSITVGAAFSMTKAFGDGASSSFVKTLAIPSVGLETYF